MHLFVQFYLVHYLIFSSWQILLGHFLACFIKNTLSTLTKSTEKKLSLFISKTGLKVPPSGDGEVSLQFEGAPFMEKLFLRLFVNLCIKIREFLYLKLSWCCSDYFSLVGVLEVILEDILGKSSIEMVCSPYGLLRPIHASHCYGSV